RQWRIHSDQQRSWWPRPVLPVLAWAVSRTQYTNSGWARSDREKHKRKRAALDATLPEWKQITTLIRFQNPTPLVEARGCTSNSYCGEPIRADEWIASIGRERAYIRAPPARTQ